MPEHSTDTHDHQGGHVEIGRLPDGGVSVRAGSTPQDGLILRFTREEWDAFVAGVKNGEFDPLRALWDAERLSLDR